MKRIKIKKYFKMKYYKMIMKINIKKYFVRVIYNNKNK